MRVCAPRNVDIKENMWFYLDVARILKLQTKGSALGQSRARRHGGVGAGVEGFVNQYLTFALPSPIPQIWSVVISVLVLYAAWHVLWFFIRWIGSYPLLLLEVLFL